MEVNEICEANVIFIHQSFSCRTGVSTSESVPTFFCKFLGK